MPPPACNWETLRSRMLEGGPSNLCQRDDGCIATALIPRKEYVMPSRWPARLPVGLILALLVASPQMAAAQTVRSGAGAGTTAARDQFRTDLGGGNVAGANGSFGGVRREINWDGVPDNFSAPNNLPFDFF